VHEDLTGDHLLKLFPPDLSLHLQTMLLTLLHKHHTNWKQEISKHQVKTNVPSSDLSSGISMPHWPHQDDPTGHLDPNDLPTYRPTTGDATTWQSVPVSIQQDAGSPDNLVRERSPDLSRCCFGILCDDFTFWQTVTFME